MNREMIYTVDLSKQFGQYSAVDGVNLHVDVGEVLAILGPNGAGKSTTVRMLTSMIRPSRGFARVGGYDVISQADQVRASVGVLNEQHGLYDRMSATEYLHFFGELFGLEPSRFKKHTEELLERFDLCSARHRRLGEYSKGMRQKVALARTLLHDPAILLLDEPTSAMDPESTRTVRDLILSLRSDERSIVLCTHNLAEAEELADKIAIMRKGKIIAQGTPGELKERILGHPEFELKLSHPVGFTDISLPFGVSLVGTGSDWFRYQIPNPELNNPNLLRQFIAQSLPVLSFQEVPRSLEQVYMRVANQFRKEEIDVE